MFDKNLTPNLIAVAIILTGWFMPGVAGDIILQVGLFALSGALTNWLAVHMLFERVPGLYGSGVIPLHFNEFKQGILTLVRDHMFKREVVEEVLASGAQGASHHQSETNNVSEGDDKQKNNDSDASNPSATPTVSPIDLQPVIKGLDLDIAYNQLTTVIMESSFGSMLGMVGGASALEPMRTPFKNRMEQFLLETSKSPRFQQAVSAQLSSMTSSDEFLRKIEAVVATRLDQLTPEMVKDIMQAMIRKHLGWLVVWGAVFGGLIGLLSALLLQVI